MTVKIKSPEEIVKMRAAGRLAAEVLFMIKPHIKSGITTNELDQLCHDHIVNVQMAIPAPLHYHDYPKSICTSVNQQVCHGIPNDRKLKNGDIINIDITVIKDGYHGDTSRMFWVDQPSIMSQRVIDISRECLSRAIKSVKPGARLGDVGHAIQRHAENNNCSVVREYCGHGIGREFHEQPQVLHYGTPGTGLVLEEGMTFTIEPMVNASKRHVKLLPDGWTVVTKDRAPSAQWEHTIVVTATGYEVLTLQPGEKI